MKKESFIESAIRHLAASYDGDLFVAATFERTVLVWDMITGKRLARLETILDFGGMRLALSMKNVCCLAASYEKEGLACYDILKGSLCWQRKDLRKIQKIVLSPNERYLYCCFDEKPCHVIDVITGQTCDQFRGASRIWVSHFADLTLQEKRNLHVVDSGGKEKFSVSPDSFGVLDADFSRDHLCLSESGDSVRIFELESGAEVWRYSPPENHHVLKVASSNGDSVFHGIQWNYEEGGPQALLRFCLDNERSEFIRELDSACEFEFCRKGTQFLTSTGELIECQTGNVVMRFKFPQEEYSRQPLQK